MRDRINLLYTDTPFSLEGNADEVSSYMARVALKPSLLCRRMLRGMRSAKASLFFLFTRRLALATANSFLA